MKRILYISLIIAYILPSIGVTISKHYCGGSVSSISFIGQAEDNCGCGNKKMKEDCCKDEITQFKIQDKQSQTNNPQVSLQQIGFRHVFVNDFIRGLIVVNESNNSFFGRWRPPDIVESPLFLVNQSFLI